MITSLPERPLQSHPYYHSAEKKKEEKKREKKFNNKPFKVRGEVI